MNTDGTEEGVGEIRIPLHNEMSAKFILLGNDVYDVDAEINILAVGESDILAEITPRVIGESDKLAEIKIMYSGYSDVFAEIQPIINNDLLAEIIVFPGNVMSALYEVVNPPEKKLVLNPIEDTFTRVNSSFNTLNYGGSNSLNVGSFKSEEYQSYLRFDFTNFSKKNVLLNATLRLNYNGEFPSDTQLELLLSNQRWTEYGTTGRNQPTDFSLLLDEYTHNKTSKYIEFKITEAVVEWVMNADINFGLSLKKVNSDDVLINFRSRESGKPPTLTLTYYDSRIYSASRTQTPAEIMVMYRDNGDVNSEITVSSSIGYEDILAELYVHRYEDPVDYDVLAELNVSRESINAEITISQTDDNDILAELDVSVRDSDIIEAEITVSKAIIEAELVVAYTDSVDSEITVIKSADEDMLAELSVTREFIEANIFIKYADDILAELTVELFEDDDISAEISISREHIDAEITIKYSDDIDAEIDVTRRLDNDIDAEISVTRLQVDAEIIVRAIGVSDVYAEITPRLQDDSDIDSSISITREYVLAEITVVETSDIKAEIHVSYNSDILAEINVHESSDVLAIIDVINVNDILAEISVTRQDVNAEIMIPYWGNSDVLAEIIPRVYGIAEVDASIQVGQPEPVGESYAFII